MKTRYWLYLGAVLLIFGAGYGLSHLQATAALARRDMQHSEALGNIRKQKEAETQKVRDTEKRLNTKADETRASYEIELSRRQIIIDGLRTAESHQHATAVGLRNDLNAYITRKPTADPACPSDPRTAALGALLQDALDVAEQNDATAREIAEGAERHSSEVRVLQMFVKTVCRGGE